LAPLVLFIADVSNIFTLPGAIVDNADTTYFELGQVQPGTPVIAATATNNVSAVNNAWGGVDGKMLGGVLGVWFNRTISDLSNINTGWTPPTGGNAGAAAAAAAVSNTVQARLGNQIDLVYGYALSDSTTLGLGLSRGTNDTKTETVTTSTSSQETDNDDYGVSLGLEQKDLGFLSLLEVGLQYNSRSGGFTNIAAATDKITVGGSAFNVRVGGDVAGKDGAFGRIELGLNSQSLDVKDDFATAPASGNFVESKNSALAWNAGYAMGMNKDKGMGLFGLMLAGLSQDREEDNNVTAVNKFDASTLRLQASTAGEAKINSWFSVRAGLSSDLFYNTSNVTETGPSGSTTKVTVTNDAHAGTVADPNATASMGVTFNLGDITIDGVLNQGLLYTGTYLVSGIPGAVSSQVSLTWPWGGAKE